MTGALIILAVTVAVGILLYLTRSKKDDGQEQTSDPAASDRAPGAPAENEPEVCCGRHAVCEKGLLKAEELYYNDEELDRYAGKDPQEYAPEEIEEFREVLYTLRPAEVYKWGVALTQRDIALPLDLRDEWMMLCQ